MHSRDVLDVILRGETPDLRAIARPPVFVSDTMSISNFLRELQQHRQQCAVVLDEHGTAIGLAFREDALEEIVGPLGDEFDSEDADFVELSEGIYEITPFLVLDAALGTMRVRTLDRNGALTGVANPLRFDVVLGLGVRL